MLPFLLLLSRIVLRYPLISYDVPLEQCKNKPPRVYLFKSAYRLRSRSEGWGMPTTQLHDRRIDGVFSE